MTTHFVLPPPCPNSVASGEHKPSQHRQVAAAIIPQIVSFVAPTRLAVNDLHRRGSEQSASRMLACGDVMSYIELWRVLVSSATIYQDLRFQIAMKVKGSLPLSSLTSLPFESCCRYFWSPSATSFRFHSLSFSLGV